jgi:acyl dehydratase
MSVTELDSAPSLARLYPKALIAGFTHKGGDLPDRTYAQSHVDIDPEHLAAYNRVCGFRLTDELPATYPHMLTFPLQIKLMSDADFPFPLAGSVHVANRITQTSPLTIGEKLDLRVHVENLRPHAKGKQFDMVSEALMAGEVVWTDVSTYLSRASAEKSTSARLRRGGGTGETADKTEKLELEPTARWRVPGDLGRRYAEVSGDRNPIHLYPLTAKMFGFPRAIAHGMWTKAHCLAAFEGRLPAAYTVEVRFKAPVLLPSTVAFAAAPDGAGWSFQLFNARKAKPHLDGTISPLP